MATKKTPARASRRTPARAPSKLAILPPTPVADGTAVLVFRGGADLSFRDGPGTKRRVLRGVPFVVDAATAELLLATDPTVAIVDLVGNTGQFIVLNTRDIEPAAAGVTDLITAPATPGEVGMPPQPAPVAPIEGMPSGAIRLDDLPPGAVIGKG